MFMKINQLFLTISVIEISQGVKTRSDDVHWTR